MNLKVYTLNFDGSCKPNPGEMTSGYIIKENDGAVAASETINGGYGTSNLAEYYGLECGLKKAIELGIKHIIIIGDSQLIIKQITGEWKAKKLMAVQKEKILKLLTNFHTCDIKHVLRKFNKEADQLSKRKE